MNVKRILAVSFCLCMLVAGMSFSASATENEATTLLGDENVSAVSEEAEDGKEIIDSSENSVTLEGEDDDVTTPVVTDKITVKFELIDEGNPREYGIFLEAEENKIINRFTSANLAFILNSDSLSYTITPANGISLLGCTAGGISGYEFKTSGKTESGEIASITDDEILIGYITFYGYNDTPANFGVNTNYTSNRVGTSKRSDSEVYEYTPSKTEAGILDIESGSLNELEYTLTKRDVKVTINFNNSVKAGNTADYNDFTVTLTGVNGEVHKGYIGSGEDGNYDSGYKRYRSSLNFNVTAGIRYTVELKGAGYRTFRYPVLVTSEETEALELTFWNNVKDASMEIEDGNSASEKTVTFLAGDIVADDKINIYDLSAVVSYFGCEITSENAHKYKKYDLNRDGCIDSRDVAYVMVSWGY